MGYSIKSTLKRVDNKVETVTQGEINKMSISDVSNTASSSSSSETENDLKIEANQQVVVEEDEVRGCGRRVIVAAGINDCSDDTNSGAAAASEHLDQQQQQSMLREEELLPSPRAPLLERLAAMAELQQAKEEEEDEIHHVVIKRNVEVGPESVIATAGSSEMERNTLVITPASSNNGSSNSLASKNDPAESMANNGSSAGLECKEEEGAPCDSLNCNIDSTSSTATENDHDTSSKSCSTAHQPAMKRPSTSLHCPTEPPTQYDRHKHPPSEAAASSYPKSPPRARGRPYYTPIMTHPSRSPATSAYREASRPWYPPPPYHPTTYHPYYHHHHSYPPRHHHPYPHYHHPQYPPYAYPTYPQHQYRRVAAGPPQETANKVKETMSAKEEENVMKVERTTPENSSCRSAPVQYAVPLQHATSIMADAKLESKESHELEPHKEDGVPAADAQGDSMAANREMKDEEAALESACSDSTKQGDDELAAYAGKGNHNIMIAADAANNQYDANAALADKRKSSSSANGEPNAAIISTDKKPKLNNKATASSPTSVKPENYHVHQTKKLPPKKRKFRVSLEHNEQSSDECKGEVHPPLSVDQRSAVYITPSPSDDSHDRIIYGITQKKGKKIKNGGGALSVKKKTKEEAKKGSKKCDAASADTSNPADGRKSGQSSSVYHPASYSHHPGYYHPMYPAPYYPYPSYHSHHASYRGQQNNYGQPRHHQHPQSHPPQHPAKPTKAETRDDKEPKKASPYRPKVPPLLARSAHLPQQRWPESNRLGHYPDHNMPPPHPHYAYYSYHHHYRNTHHGTSASGAPAQSSGHAATEPRPNHVVSNPVAGSNSKIHDNKAVVRDDKKETLVKAAASVSCGTASTVSSDGNTSKKMQLNRTKQVYESSSQVPLNLRSIMPLLPKTTKGRCIPIPGSLLQHFLNSHGIMNHQHYNARVSNPASGSASNDPSLDTNAVPLPVLPPFDEIVNFPEFLTRNSPGKKRRRRRKRKSEVSESSSLSGGDGGIGDDGGDHDRRRHCVMCGTCCYFDVGQNETVSPVSTLNSGSGSGDDDGGSVTNASSPSSPAQRDTEHEEQQFQQQPKKQQHQYQQHSFTIPRQNKGLCTSCDIKVWLLIPLSPSQHVGANIIDKHSTTVGAPTTKVLTTSSSTETSTIKWCKGCKNFRSWPQAFGITKSRATKCTRCRDRQREKYASTKRKMESMRSICSS